MARPRTSKVATAIGEPITLGSEKLRKAELEVKIGRPPVVLEVQPHSYIVLERPEELRQWEEDLRNFYGIAADASALRGRACETCSCCTDDCGMLA